MSDKLTKEQIEEIRSNLFRIVTGYSGGLSGEAVETELNAICDMASSNLEGDTRREAWKRLALLWEKHIFDAHTDYPGQLDRDKAREELKCLGEMT